MIKHINTIAICLLMTFGVQCSQVPCITTDDTSEFNRLTAKTKRTLPEDLKVVWYYLKQASCTTNLSLKLDYTIKATYAITTIQSNFKTEEQTAPADIKAKLLADTNRQSIIAALKTISNELDTIKLKGDWTKLNDVMKKVENVIPARG